MFVGCPERDPNDEVNQTDRGMCSICEDWNMQTFLNCYKGDSKERKIGYLSKKADYIFSHRDTNSFILDKSLIKPFYCIADSPFGKEEIKAKFKEDKQIIITHLPSNKALKGTKYVERSIMDIKALGYNIQYLSDGLKHTQVQKILQKTHILIDQFSIGNGLLSIEGMANGCVVICRTAKWFREDFPGLPLISCEPEELTKTLIYLLENHENMLDIALKSFEYYKKFHTPEVVGRYYRDILGLN